MKVLSACIHLIYNTETDSKSSSFVVNTLSWPGKEISLVKCPVTSLATHIVSLPTSLLAPLYSVTYVIHSVNILCAD